MIWFDSVDVAGLRPSLKNDSFDLFALNYQMCCCFELVAAAAAEEEAAVAA